MPDDRTRCQGTHINTDNRKKKGEGGGRCWAVRTARAEAQAAL